MLDALFQNYRLTPDIEITLEANPSSLTVDKAKAWLDAGINRLSIGVQSLDDEQLKFLGRLHHADGALSALAAAFAAGFSNVSADLIYGVYRQPPEQACAEVKHIATSGVTHLSAYMLTIEPGTQFGALHRKGQLPLLEDALVGQSFGEVHDTLAECGLQHYEISNFAFPGKESRHNLGYWRGEPYLGIGLGAFGTLPTDANHDQPVRYRNTASVERYMKLQQWCYPSPELAGSMAPYHQVEPLGEKYPTNGAADAGAASARRCKPERALEPVHNRLPRPKTRPRPVAQARQARTCRRRTATDPLPTLAVRRRNHCSVGVKPRVG